MNRKVWAEQVIRVREGQDPIGIVRASKNGSDDALIRITSDNIGGLSLEEATHFFEMTQEERSAYVAEHPYHTRGRGRSGAARMA